LLFLVVMSAPAPCSAALISVSDKTGLSDLARSFHEAGVMLFATSGSLTALRALGLPVESIELYTGQKEILDGRVKTLHPKIHAGILARRDEPSHMSELEANGIVRFDYVVVNLYPFVQKVAEFSDRATTFTEMREFVDIGGPTMVRAAAKNCKDVVALIDPTDYPLVISHLSATHGGEGTLLSEEARERCAAKVFCAMASYEFSIARYLANDSNSHTTYSEKSPLSGSSLKVIEGGILSLSGPLRYGENPHQKAAVYTESFPQLYAEAPSVKVLQGKELSYNNHLDVDAALKLIRCFNHQRSGCAIMKHLNPCGAAYGSSPLEALEKAKKGDPRSHFGGVIVFNQALTEDVARNIAQDFAEIVIAPGIDKDAQEIFSKSKNLRIVLVPELLLHTSLQRKEMRVVETGVLIQEADIINYQSILNEVNESLVQCGDKDRFHDDIVLAWGICARVSSNAIVLVRDGMLLSVGAGQMSRIDSVELALQKAWRFEHALKGATAASDAFFPFPDGIESLLKAGIGAVIAPGGAKKDAEVVKVAHDNKATLLFASRRHFRH
jgi:phosphoribosylaminoimidazolecarboxamide formyltransferase / IMP cyclohydrolase